MLPLILASSSPFRRTLLEKLQVPFTCTSPDVDESELENETAEELVARLAEAKAQALARANPNSLIIGSDQVALANDQILGKPYTREKALQQLASFSGQTVTFLTGLCLLDTATDSAQVTVEPFYVHFRELNEVEIARYVDIEQPLNCAGSFKSEGLGITLFRKLEGEDPNTLIGLPLIRLCEFLRNSGYTLP